MWPHQSATWLEGPSQWLTDDWLTCLMIHEPVEPWRWLSASKAAFVLQFGGPYLLCCRRRSRRGGKRGRVCSSSRLYQGATILGSRPSYWPSPPALSLILISFSYYRLDASSAGGVRCLFHAVFPWGLPTEAEISNRFDLLLCAPSVFLQQVEGACYHLR